MSSRNEKVVKNLGEWFDQQNTWMRSMIKKSKSDPLWRHVGLIMAQFDGLVAGYKAAAKPEQVFVLYEGKLWLPSLPGPCLSFLNQLNSFLSPFIFNPA